MRDEYKITDKVTLQRVVELVEQNSFQADDILQRVRKIKAALGLFEEAESYNATEISNKNKGMVHVINDMSIDIRKALCLAELDLMLIAELIGNKE